MDVWLRRRGTRSVSPAVPRTLTPSQLARRRDLLVVLGVIALLATACGTRVDKAAYMRAIESQSQGAAGPGGSVAAVPGSPDAPTADGTIPAPAAQAGAGSQSRATVPAASRTAGTEPASGSPNLEQPGSLGLSTAQVGSTVLVGFDLPETGAAPLPMGWQQDVTTVQKWLDANPIYGRKVVFDVQDDGYDPAKGAAACMKNLDAHPVLALGYSEPTVEVECGKLYSEHGIPYLMRGASSTAVTGCPVPICYFATMSDARQGTLMGEYIMDQMDGAHHKICIISENDDPYFPDNLVSEVNKLGGKVLVDESEVPRTPDFSSTIVKFQQAGCDYSVIGMGPSDAVTISTQASSMGYHPTWFGAGTTWNYNLTLQAAGMAMDGAISFSPWASMNSAAADEWKQVDAQYDPGSEPDDIGLVMFGLGSLVRAALQHAGPDLSEASLVASLDSLQFSVPLWVPITYTASAASHLGPTSVAVFKGDGHAQQFDQITGFMSSF